MDDEQDDNRLPETIELPITDVLDLHSFRPSEIGELVREWLEQVHARGWQQVRIIHGKGKGVQRDLVRRILAADPRVLEYGDPPGHHGGWGATFVTLAGPPPVEGE